ncbi:SusC/RagA family TonB-linked outer membrane protein [Bacteroides cellulosilyticus]|jgi:TonB-linked SusC/RagA family outer membrane protein|uniref:SusC/RagA family TonB-linked outer membrane protein n=1 Tax=Bacteroides cellulosilyticus TaxID=246787 RepID=UPI000E5074CA|nr:TonB-dependent receptor [Bacteroides cellulosilyticus]RGU26870.1 TonB-dependent receptor [Bacteroides cellulosilyticus]
MEKQENFCKRQAQKLCRLFPVAILLFLFLSVPLKGYSNEAFSSEGMQQNTVKVTGTVKDTNGEPIIGANVMVVGSATGVITDIDGNFTLNVPVGSKLQFSFIGYKEQVVSVKKGISLNIVLEEDAQMLGEVEVVAYGVQKKVSVTGAISSMRGDDLLKTPAGSISNILSGQVTGISSVQYSGEPGADAADIYVRGIATTNNATPLIQVDGVERDFSQIDPNEIESVTILKDASATAVFGVRGANGVILITTKRGAEGKAKISFTTSAGVNVRTKELEFANSYQYASYVNMMRTNDGNEPLYSDEQLAAFRDHTNPLLYPDINWIDYCMNKAAFQSQHNVSISGGTNNMRYFVSAGLFTQDGMFKQFNLTDDFNFDYKRYNYRANLDFDISKTTLLSVNIGGRVESKRTPESGEDQNQLFRKLYWAVPFASAGIVDGKYIKTNADYVTKPGADGLESYYGKGFRNQTTNVLNLDLVLDQKLDFITKGLSIKLKGSYNSSYSTTKIASSSVATYTPVVDDKGAITYKKSGSDSQTSYREGDYGKGRDWYMELALNYNRKFGNHSVTGLFLYNQSKRYYPGGTYDYIPTGYVGLVGRVTYDWKTRYLAEFNVGYNGSENFNPENRYGFFPAGSIGWIVSEEPFFAPIKKVVNYFKVRATLGMVGNDNYAGQRFLYLPGSYGYGQNNDHNGPGGFFGQNIGNAKPGAWEATQSNPYAKWETAVKQNYGLDFNILNDHLSVSADYFIEKRRDILRTPDYLPGILGMTLPAINVNKVENKGFEIQAKWNDRIGTDFRYWANFNISFARNKIVFMNEVEQNEPWMYQTGRRINSRSMYKFWGFYDETADLRYQEEFGIPISDHGITLQPGDAVYVDLNKDGKLDGNDATRDIGFTDLPEYTAGLNLGFSWKNFDFSMQWTGAWNVDRMLSEFRQPLGDTQNKGLLLYQYENTWRSSEDSYTAKFPRITATNRKNNFEKGSDLYLINASYLRLKNIEIGYNFDFPFMRKLKLNSCRMYVNGYNLLTFTAFDWGDPESRQSDRPNYPLTRVFNIGLKLGF